MDILYHASGYKQDELMPGYRRSGKLTQWDKTESNVYLYTTTDREEAISQAFASMLEKNFDVVHYGTKDTTIRAKMRRRSLPTKAELAAIPIYLYTIKYDEKDGWRKVNNKHNGLDTEYKTDQQIDANIIKRETIDTAKWLEDKNLIFSLEDYPAWMDL